MRGRYCPWFGLLALVVLMLFPPRVKADTYELFLIGDTQNIAFDGLTANGEVLTGGYNAGYCYAFGLTDPDCWVTWLDGVETGASLTMPTLTLDEGTVCTPTNPPAGMTVLSGRCNNGYEVFVALAGNGSRDVFTGPDPVADLILADETPILHAINSIGDIVLEDGSGGALYDAVDLTTETPEPNGLSLAGLGVVAGLAGWAYRRARSRRFARAGGYSL